MDVNRHHSEWLSLLDIQGVFLTLEVLNESFPQGLETLDSGLRSRVGEVYQEWLDENHDEGIHREWIIWVLTEVLGYPEKLLIWGKENIPVGYQHPDFYIDGLLTHPKENKPLLLIKTLPPTQKLEGIPKGERFSPTTAFMQHLRLNKLRLGLLTNGEQWMLLNVPEKTTCGFISWFSQIWLDESLTLRSFVNLLGISRFLKVEEKDTLVNLLERSIYSQQEVTDSLGNQVKKSIEILIQRLEILSQDTEGRYLLDFSEWEIYEGVMSVMLRLIFLLTAEAKELLPLDNPIYQQNYSISSLPILLREQADTVNEEILALHRDAWGRIIANFRAVFAGISHPSLELISYEGNLFNPDRYPFLEGRGKNTSWRDSESKVIDLDNRTLLHVLEGLTILRVAKPGGGYEPRSVSYKSLDVQQIGHVYESLLDHKVERASSTTLKLIGSKNSLCLVELEELERKREEGEEELVKFLVKVTKRSKNAIVKNLYPEDVSQIDSVRDVMVSRNQVLQRFLFICRHNESLWERIKPFSGLIEWDVFGYPRIIPEGYLHLTTGELRKETGSHYTPGELSREVVRQTVNPIIYKGCKEGKPESEWELISEEEILGLKICDIACGSGAFLVQTCRYLGEKLLEIWEREKRVRVVKDEEREKYLTLAKRLVVERCIYGVDINPIAVEMCKLSLWLDTLQRDKSFTFIDHAIKVGDSLLGVSVNQLANWDMDKSSNQSLLGSEEIRRLLEEVIELRLEIETNLLLTPSEKSYKLAICNSRIADLISRGNLLISSYLVEGKSSRELSELRKYLLLMSQGKVDSNA